MSPAFLLALALQAQDPQVADLKQAYAQSCLDRAYGTFDDVCTQMGDQIRAYERQSEKAARARKPPRAAAAAPAPAPALLASGEPALGDPPPAR